MSEKLRLKSPDERSIPAEKIEVYQVIAGERIDQIAAKAYGSEAYWPIIAAFNQLTDAASLFPGQLLRVPHRAYVEEPES